MRPALICAPFAALVALGCSQPSGGSVQDSPTAAPEHPAPVAEGAEGARPASAEGAEARVAAVRAFIREKAPKSELFLVVEGPFVVVGDRSARDVRRHAEGTVRWARTRLKDAFFPKDPDRALTIWLFTGEKSYRRHALALWNEAPDTPYGYYSSSNNALVMNIATGGGTLVHEIVHPYVEANFPDAPPWLNEGLGSLFEASRDRNEAIVGMLNWRLPGLQDAIRSGDVPSFKTLMAMDAATFYGEGSGTFYAQARYLLFYLQEQGLLRRFYKQFVANVKDDPSGYATLAAVLERDDLPRFQREWERWALGLQLER